MRIKASNLEMQEQRGHLAARAVYLVGGFAAWLKEKPPRRHERQVYGVLKRTKHFKHLLFPTGLDKIVLGFVAV